MNSTDKPIYFLPKGSSTIDDHRSLFESLERTHSKKLLLRVEPDTVKEGDTGMIKHLLLALQHYPAFMPKMLFAIEFNFTVAENSHLCFKESEWKYNPDYQRWFHGMLSFPVAPFFLRDQDARFYALAGDMLADRVTQISKETKTEERGKIIFKGEQVDRIIQRIFSSCWSFLVYCHGSGYDPQNDIEAVLACFDSPITYESIRTQYEEDVKKGIEFKVAKKS